MSKPVARVGDSHSCPKTTPSPHHGGTIASGSPNVTVGGQAAARVGDKITCEDGSEGIIKQSNACLIINGKRAARVDDQTDHDGNITSGASSVKVADGDPFIEIGDEGFIEIGDNVIFGEEGLVIIGTDATAGIEFGPAGVLAGAAVGAIIYFYTKPPNDLKAFPDAKKAGRKGNRKRWIDKKGRIYEWDSQHGKVEVYDKTGKNHLGEFDPETGEQTKLPDKSRNIDK